MTKYLLLAVTLILTACSNKPKTDISCSGKVLTCYSQFLKMTDCGDYTSVDIKNPWDTTAYLQRFIIVNEGNKGISVDGYKTIIAPLKHSLVYSTVHASAIDELGGISAVDAVADAEYFKQPSIIAGLKDGTVKNVGSSLSPNTELIAASKPDAIITSPYQNAGHGVIENLQIPIIDMADYMETTPLGRAEWIKLLGALYGNYEEADSIFNATVTAYNALKAKAPQNHPKVLTENINSGVWYVPGGNSYMAQMIRDAGGDYPWSNDKSTGSLQLDFATVYNKAHDADFWFVKTYQYQPTLKALRDAYTLNEKFDAFKSGNVYGVDTYTSTFFEDYPFHPERLLRDYIIVLAPDSLPGESTYYYKKAE